MSENPPAPGERITDRMARLYGVASNGQTRRVINAAIRKAVPGGSGVLDLLTLMSARARSGDRTAKAAADALGIIADEMADAVVAGNFGPPSRPAGQD